MRATALITTALFSVCSAHTALAGAWTQKAGNGQAILNYFYYSTDEFYNNNGGEAAQLDYIKHELNPYYEYGLTDWVTIGANLSLQRVYQKFTFGYLTNWGMGDTELFSRIRLHKADNWVVSMEPVIKLPSPQSLNNIPAIGSDNVDAGLTLAGGYGFEAFGQNHFATVEAGYRHRFSDPENQWRYTLTAGIGLTPEWQFMPQLFITRRTKDPAVVAFTQTSADDFDLTKLQLSAVYKFRRDISFQIGAFSHIDGTNVGGGEGALLSIWKDF